MVWEDALFVRKVLLFVLSYGSAKRGLVAFPITYGDGWVGSLICSTFDLHLIPNSVQSLHDLSHLEIIFQKAQSRICL